MGGEQPRFELSVPQIAGGALAAVTAAVAASYLGVAGTIIGAAVASVAGTVGNAVYTHYLKRTSEKVREHAVVALRRRGDEPPTREEGEGELATAVHATVREEPVADTLVMAPVEARRPVPWLKVGVTAALVFAISMAAILTFNVLSERTVTEVVRGQQPAPAEQRQAPVKDEPGREQPGPAPSQEERTPRESPTPTPSRTEESEPAPSVTPSEEPRSTPSDAVPPQDATTSEPPADEPPAEGPEQQPEPTQTG